MELDHGFRLLPVVNRLFLSCYRFHSLVQSVAAAFTISSSPSWGAVILRKEMIEEEVTCEGDLSLCVMILLTRFGSDDWHFFPT